MADWFEREVDAASIEALSAAGYTPLQARLLALRGVGPADAAAYFHPSLAALAAPEELPHIGDAVEFILRFVRGCGGEGAPAPNDGGAIAGGLTGGCAIAGGLTGGGGALAPARRIVVFGDYDCDGVCATAILYTALNALAPGRIGYFLPERLTEGYGMSEASVARMLAEFPDVALVVTVDNGINSVERIAELKARGIAVVVTDHHLAGETLPDCLIVNPKVAAPEQLAGLCGAGVAFLLSNALVKRAKAEGLYTGPNIGGPLLVMAGLATVTDIMPLSGQNRILVAEALRRFTKWAPLGLRELYDRASRAASAALTTRDFGFLIGPRINAAGRIASGRLALDLVLATDRETARELARQVDVHNSERKTIEQEMTERALARVIPGAAAQVLDLSGGHPGVAGIVASRVLEKLSDAPVPVCVVVDGHGSARAPDGYNVRDAFAAASEALTAFGGHAAAGGFSVREGQLGRFRELFAAACAGQAAGFGERRPGTLQYDACVNGGDLTMDFVEWLQQLEPFGEGNPEPIFAMKGVYLADARPLGAEGKHLQITLRGHDLPRAVWWGHGDLVDSLRAESAKPHDLLFAASISTWNEPHVELRLLALEISRQ